MTPRRETVISLYCCENSDIESKMAYQTKNWHVWMDVLQVSELQKDNLGDFL